MAGKVTVSLALHWPHVTGINGFPPMDWRGRWAPAYALLVEYGELHLYLTVTWILHHLYLHYLALLQYITMQVIYYYVTPSLNLPSFALPSYSIVSTAYLHYFTCAYLTVLYRCTLLWGNLHRYYLTWAYCTLSSLSLHVTAVGMGEWERQWWCLQMMRDSQYGD